MELKQFIYNQKQELDKFQDMYNKNYSIKEMPEEDWFEQFMAYLELHNNEVK